MICMVGAAALQLKAGRNMVEYCALLKFKPDTKETTRLPSTVSRDNAQLRKLLALGARSCALPALCLLQQLTCLVLLDRHEISP